ncbi:MAG: aminotransferase class V-fold PLP-dependent enzyme [Desulfobacula sp.]|nr:aminotransferase class V-fold PLP-dependent enzyme [Desulfobacula sp.]
MTFLKDGKNLISILEQYHKQSIEKMVPVLRQRTISDLHEKFGLANHIKNGDLSGDMLDGFIKTYLENTTKLYHPGYMAHQVGAPHSTGALGSLIDGFTNNAMAIYEMGPGAAAIEFFMVNYLLEKIGWEPMPTQIEERLIYPHGAGVLTHGGSLANMTALLAARNHLDKNVREKGNPGDLVILAPDSCHYSILKAAGMIGIGEDNLIALETDNNGRVKVSKMGLAVIKATRANKRIVALVANACSTGTGLYDPIDEIADFCKEHNIWFHVDGAHGASALFSSTHKSRLKGLIKADSMIIDAHKMLRTPTVCASLLVKDAATLDHTFEHTASYLFHEKKQPGFDFIGQAIECTKAGLGLKFFMTLAALGETNIQDYIDTTFRVALRAYDYIRSQPDFCVPCKPESNILCFRINACDEDQIAIRDRLIEAGRFYISSTELAGVRYLRIVVISPKTSLGDIKQLIATIREIQADRVSGT